MQGACIIRMLNEVLGDVKFFEGINLYLKRYEYSNAKQSQLYDAINEVSDVVQFTHIKIYSYLLIKKIYNLLELFLFK